MAFTSGNEMAAEEQWQNLWNKKKNKRHKQLEELQKCELVIEANEEKCCWKLMFKIMFKNTSTFLQNNNNNKKFIFI